MQQSVCTSQFCTPHTQEQGNKARTTSINICIQTKNGRQSRYRGGYGYFNTSLFKSFEESLCLGTSFILLEVAPLSFVLCGLQFRPLGVFLFHRSPSHLKWDPMNAPSLMTVQPSKALVSPANKCRCTGHFKSVPVKPGG